MVDFLVIGSFNAVSYKEVFPLIKDQKMSLGYNRVGEFCDGSKFGNINWFTTFYVDKPPFLELTKTYDDHYKEYDLFNAINVDRTVDIPYDYYGVMGVPLTFLEKWNPEQFEIVDARDYRKKSDLSEIKYMTVQILSGPKYTSDVEGKKKYVRILIRRKKLW